IAPGGQFSATIQLNGPPSTGVNSTVPFALSCGNLPVGVTCVFHPPTVTGANPQFTVTFTSSGSTAHVAPWPIGPAGPWYMLFAVLLSVLSALAMMGSRNQVL